MATCVQGRCKSCCYVSHLRMACVAMQIPRAVYPTTLGPDPPSMFVSGASARSASRLQGLLSCRMMHKMLWTNSSLSNPSTADPVLHGSFMISSASADLKLEDCENNQRFELFVLTGFSWFVAIVTTLFVAAWAFGKSEIAYVMSVFGIALTVIVVGFTLFVLHDEVLQYNMQNCKGMAQEPYSTQTGEKCETPNANFNVGGYSSVCLQQTLADLLDPLNLPVNERRHFDEIGKYQAPGSFCDMSEDGNYKDVLYQTFATSVRLVRWGLSFLMLAMVRSLRCPSFARLVAHLFRASICRFCCLQSRGYVSRSVMVSPASQSSQQATFGASQHRRPVVSKDRHAPRHDRTC